MTGGARTEGTTIEGASTLVPAMVIGSSAAVAKANGGQIVARAETGIPREVDPTGIGRAAIDRAEIDLVQTPVGTIVGQVPKQASARVVPAGAAPWPVPKPVTGARTGRVLPFSAAVRNEDQNSAEAEELATSEARGQARRVLLAVRDTKGIRDRVVRVALVQMRALVFIVVLVTVTAIRVPRVLRRFLTSRCGLTTIAMAG